MLANRAFWFAAVLLSAGSAFGQASGSIHPDEVAYQQQNYQQWWGGELETRFAELPLEGQVPEFRTPYSGHDYPDRGGGTVQALNKYDLAFHDGKDLATRHEQHDVHDPRVTPGLFGRRGGLFSRVRSRRNTQSWYGHCNGWTAAAIRHAEPEHNVTRNGVVFSPADIKGLLAEIYMYSDTEFLGGIDQIINPATLHLTLTNWLGRGQHPVGVETAVGDVVINYPIYRYKSEVERLDDRQVAVQMTVTHAVNTPQEYDRSPQYQRDMYFHYVLDLDEEGRVVGGRYYNDSARIDMLWTPLQPRQGGEEGNEQGNPHLNVKEVLAIWRESVSEETRRKWLNIDPTDEDRLTDEEAAAIARELAEASQPPEKAAEKASETSSETGAETAGEADSDATVPGDDDGQ